MEFCFNRKFFLEIDNSCSYLSFLLFRTNNDLTFSPLTSVISSVKSFVKACYSFACFVSYNTKGN